MRRDGDLRLARQQWGKTHPEREDRAGSRDPARVASRGWRMRFTARRRSRARPVATHVSSGVGAGSADAVDYKPPFRGHEAQASCLVAGRFRCYSAAERPVRSAAHLAIVALILAPYAQLDREVGLHADPGHSSLDTPRAGLFVPGDVWQGISEHTVGVPSRDVSVTRPVASEPGRTRRALPPPASFLVPGPSRGPPRSLEL